MNLKETGEKRMNENQNKNSNESTWKESSVHIRSGIWKKRRRRVKCAINTNMYVPSNKAQTHGHTAHKTKY